MSTRVAAFGAALGVALRAAVGLALGVVGLLSCHSARTGQHPERLSEWGLLVGAPSEHVAAPGVLPYDLNTPLFSDYADKLRLVRLPAGTSASYVDGDVFAFPVGTVIAKTFAYPLDARAPGGSRRLLETRLLVHEPAGWVGLPYIWNAEQTEARLEITGGPLEVSWIDAGGAIREHTYRVPNVNQCKGCHKTDGERMAPIGPRAEQLNRDFAYPEGLENQLAHWVRQGALAGAPAPERLPRYPTWDDPATGTLDARARVWLEINCAHCHNPSGPARTSNLDLRVANQDPTLLGVFKSPVAAGRGSGDLLHDIVPGAPERSILVYRLESLDPGVMMPELGRSLVHTESLAMIQEWIAAMEDPFAGQAVGAAER